MTTVVEEALKFPKLRILLSCVVTICLLRMFQKGRLSEQIGNSMKQKFRNKIRYQNHFLQFNTEIKLYTSFTSNHAYYFFNVTLATINFLLRSFIHGT